MTFNDEGEVSGAVVMMLKGENSNQVIKNVKEKNCSDSENTSKRSRDRTFLDRTKMVNNAIGTVEKTLQKEH
jgi:cobalt-zinc-cadmium resistance protein CzcA